MKKMRGEQICNCCGKKFIVNGYQSYAYKIGSIFIVCCYKCYQQCKGKTYKELKLIKEETLKKVKEKENET